ncbi:MFS transporter [Variovorax ginsengisoli]|uniref:MFS transporter n=1 Tax=Variovorax ginsengisoli TaxID=363844 RepID=A0ABT8S7Y1_9BURK|nr:MFS transporter [Variovorax ginsengisoli]MDN8615750.1 MFS transporter [Variovorax ginsengisoli]MDO1534920.1 MFS transporter [Variovorax ginsengisoli]
MIHIASDRGASALPIVALLALAMTGFLALLTETIPAGMLSQISQGMNVSEALAGQFVTLYAIGSLVAAIPLIVLTRGWKRRPLLLAALSGLLVFNTVTAVTSDYAIALIARCLAGMAGGLIWGMLVGYVRRMVPPELKGRALALASIGAPLALSLGVPAGSFLGSLLGWRSTFGLISVLTLGVMILVLRRVPDQSGQEPDKRLPIRAVLATPGVRPVLGVLILWILAHSILYTYIVPFLAPAGLSDRADLVLLVFGLSSLAGIWITGLLIDRNLRLLVLTSLGFFALASLALGIGGKEIATIYLAVIVWGVTFGGSAAQLQTATADAAGSGADVAQSILVTVWNIAIAAGAIIGGVLLETVGVASFAWVLFALLDAAVLITWASREHGFPGITRKVPT